jgi:hypothetical protein
MSRLDGYEPRHKSVMEQKFCNNGCLIVDGINVPFPDCFAHGNPFTMDPKCVIIKVRP